MEKVKMVDGKVREFADLATLESAVSAAKVELDATIAALASLAKVAPDAASALEKVATGNLAALESARARMLADTADERLAAYVGSDAPVKLEEAVKAAFASFPRGLAASVICDTVGNVTVTFGTGVKAPTAGKSHAGRAMPLPMAVTYVGKGAVKFTVKGKTYIVKSGDTFTVGGQGTQSTVPGCDAYGHAAYVLPMMGLTPVPNENVCGMVRKAFASDKSLAARFAVTHGYASVTDCTCGTERDSRK